MPASTGLDAPALQTALPLKFLPAFLSAAILGVGWSLLLGSQAPQKLPQKVPHPPAPVDAFVDKIDSAMLLADVRALSADDMAGRATGTPGSAKARGYITEALGRRGAVPVGKSWEHPFRFANQEGVNVVGLLPGTSRKERYLVLSAHYDHLGTRRGQVFNGADDNASGVAVLLAAAARFKKRPLAHSLILVAFDAEELGLLGAQAFVAAPPVPLSAIDLDVNLDMVSRNASGEIYAAGTYPHPRLRAPLERIAARSAVRLRLGHDHPGLPPGEDWTESSDHAPFHHAGIPFVYFGVEDHPDYHRPTDDADKISTKFFTGAAETILAAVVELDRMMAAEPSGQAVTAPCMYIMWPPSSEKVPQDLVLEPVVIPFFQVFDEARHGWPIEEAGLLGRQKKGRDAEDFEAFAIRHPPRLIVVHQQD